MVDSAPVGLESGVMDPTTTATEALLRAVSATLSARGDGSLSGSPQEWTDGLAACLADQGFKVAKDYHYDRAPEGHPATCYHCGRPENVDPFILPGTPLELRSSEGEAGRFRHWGGPDVWACRTHLHAIDGRDEDPTWERTMDLIEAVEHLAARDGLPEVLAMSSDEVDALISAYYVSHTERLVALDALAAKGGHQGVAARRAEGPR